MSARVHERRLAVVALIICAGIMAWLVSRGLKVGTHGHIDFFDFYWAAEAFASADIYAVGDPGYIYPPLLAFMLQPLTLLSAKAAATLWVFVNATLAAVLCWLGVDVARRAMEVSWRWERRVLATCGTFVFLTDSFRNELEWGNCNFVVMLPVLLALRWLVLRPIVAGSLLGLAAALKYLPILFLVWLIARRQWRAVAAMSVSLGLLLLLPAVQVGLSRNAQFLGSSVAGVTAMLGSARDVGNQPSTGGLTPSGAGDGLSSGSVVPARANIWPLDAAFSLSIPSGMARMVRDADLPRWTLPAGILGIAGVCVVGCWLVYRSGGYRIFWRTAPAWLVIAEGVGVATAMIAFSPQTQKRHFNMLVALVSWGIVVAARSRIRPGGRVIALAGLSLLALMTTPMVLTPISGQWLRPFMTDVWNWSGGPAYVAVICQIMVIAGTMIATSRNRGEAMIQGGAADE